MRTPPMSPRQRWELRRKIVHMSGAIYLILAQFAGQLPSAIAFLLVSLAFFSYGQFVQLREQSHHTRLHRLEARLREAAMRFEHERRAPLLFQGLIWYYFSSGIALLLFPWEPLSIAITACLFLAIGDGVSTMLGVHGTHKLIGPKTYEGTLAFLATSFIVALFLLPPWLAAFGAIVAALTELIPALWRPQKPWSKLWDDNLLIPLVSGTAMTLAAQAAGLL